MATGGGAVLVQNDKKLVREINQSIQQYSIHRMKTPETTLIMLITLAKLNDNEAVEAMRRVRDSEITLNTLYSELRQKVTSNINCFHFKK